jgi:hypothetical protein
MPRRVLEKRNVFHLERDLKTPEQRISILFIFEFACKILNTYSTHMSVDRCNTLVCSRL